MTTIEDLPIRVDRETLPPRLVTFGLGGCSVYYSTHRFSTGNHNGTPVESFCRPESPAARTPGRTSCSGR